MKTLSIFSLLGFIMLAGLVGKNAILLVDRTNQMRLERGLKVKDALLEAAETRLRPILITTMTMVCGMAPIALSTSAGSEWKSGLASALIGGLISSLLLTLVLVPVMYVKVDQWRESVPVPARRAKRHRTPRFKRFLLRTSIVVPQHHQHRDRTDHSSLISAFFARVTEDPLPGGDRYGNDTHD